jgi:glycosyltransferase involved in cell wall biosynthesis
LQTSAFSKYLHEFFPPKHANIRHVVINSIARDELALRRGIAATIIPNVLDFDNPPPVNNGGYQTFLAAFGLKSNHKTILQPTRIIQRKGIEHTIDLVKQLQKPHYKLLISHEAGDEGLEYASRIKNYALESGVDLRLAQIPISSPWHHAKQQLNGHCLWNVYAHADFVTFPSLCEGFGNAFLEAIYFKKPLLVNRYATFVSDIEPKGFDLVTMDTTLTAKTVQTVRDILQSPAKAAEMVDHNYKIAKQYFSYGVLRRRLDALMHQPAEKEETAQAVVCGRQPEAKHLNIRPQVHLFAHLKN